MSLTYKKNTLENITRLKKQTKKENITQHEAVYYLKCTNYFMQMFHRLRTICALFIISILQKKINKFIFVYIFLSSKILGYSKSKSFLWMVITQMREDKQVNELQSVRLQ